MDKSKFITNLCIKYLFVMSGMEPTKPLILWCHMFPSIFGLKYIAPNNDINIKVIITAKINLNMFYLYSMFITSQDLVPLGLVRSITSPMVLPIRALPSGEV